MTGMSDYTAKNLLNYVGGQLATPAQTSLWLALFTAAPADAGTGGTEVSGNSYARVQVAGPLTTNGTTAAGNAVLHFASVPSWIVAGMSVTDTTSGAVIPAATTVLSTTGTTVTMSANASGGGVGGTDVIQFSAFTPASSSAPVTMTNNAIITFPTPTSTGWGTVNFFGLYDASTVGNYINGDYLGNFAWLPATVSSASPGILTVKGHGYSASDPIVFSTEYGGTAPSFSQSNFTNAVNTLLVVSPATDSFSLTNAGTAVNTSSTGSGMVRKIGTQSIPGSVVASFAANALTLSLA